MSKWPLNIARPSIVRFSSYSARGGATHALHLDANESPWAPPPADKSVKDYNRYPAQQPAGLRNRLASLYGVAPETLMMGRGADEAIEVLLRTFCEAGQDSILICPPTFGYFKTAAEIQGAGVIEVPLLTDFTAKKTSRSKAVWDLAAIEKTIKAKTPKIVFLCSPNNPTGDSLSAKNVAKLCKAFPETLIVVDEAYIEFSDAASLIAMRPTYRNLVITRTLSKVYGLAGVRMGVCIADADIIDFMLKVLPPYPVQRPVEQAVLRALAPAVMPIHEARLKVWKSERERVAHALQSSEFVERIYPSDANFLLLRIKDTAELFAALGKANIKIRDFRNKIPGHVRLTISNPGENNLALEAFKVAPAISSPAGVDSLDSPAASEDRIGEVFRKTNETDIAIRVNLDDPNLVKVETGLGFFDHMLEQIAKHGGMGLTLSCEGDLEIDPHHTVEDTALAFGTALKQALGNKAGIGRYGFIMPMDETQARVAVDLSGRPAAVFKGEFPTDHVGEFPVEMCPHFFQSLAQTLGAAIHIDVEGENSHHIIEACFKGVGRALRPALARIGGDIPSTKGVL